MPSEKSEPQRAKTDRSLKTERARADLALTESQTGVEKDTDEAVRVAREQADAAVTAAREKADERLDRPEGVAAPHVLAEEREFENEVLEDERLSADESLRHEREQNARALARLLPLERGQTDRYLLTERARSDAAIDNRDEFLGIVSHDLRDLLGGIVMNAELIARWAAAEGAGTESNGPARDAADRIHRQAARMNRLIGDLLDIASIDSGRLAVMPTSGDAAALIDEAVAMFQATAAARGISLEAQLPERPLTGEFDHDRMLQVLANLIANAIKFTARGGTIEVRGEPDAAGLRVTISDTGSGIPEAMLEKVFERFSQVGISDRTGVGLGLYISRCLIDAHGGRIWAESEVGVGSRFCVTLPRA